MSTLIVRQERSRCECMRSCQTPMEQQPRPRFNCHPDHQGEVSSFIANMTRHQPGINVFLADAHCVCYDGVPHKNPSQSTD